jgi:hypothetical protein
VVHDVVDSACKCPDGASVRAGGGVANATTTCAILLVSDAHDGGSACVEGVEWSSVGDDVVQ